MSLILRPVRSSQPRGPATIDWGNPITRGLLVAATPFSRFSTNPTTVTPFNNELTFRGGGILAQPPVTYGIANSTILLVEYPIGPLSSSLWNSVELVYSDTATDYPADYGLRIRSPQTYGNLTLVARDSAGTSYPIQINVTPGNSWQPGSGVRLVRAATIDSDYLIRAFGGGVYRNQSTVLQAAASSGKIFPKPAATSASPFIGISPTATSDLSTYQSVVLRWGRVLSDAEIASISANPWQVFAANDKSIFALPGGAPAPPLPEVSFDIYLNPPVFSGGAFSEPLARLSANLPPPSFAGGATASPLARLDATLPAPVFIGGAESHPHAALHALIPAPVFVGSAAVSPQVLLDAVAPPPVFAGSAVSPPLACLAATLPAPVFAGGAVVAGEPPEARLDAVLAPPAFHGGAEVRPQAALHAIAPAPVFAGGAFASPVAGLLAELPAPIFTGGAVGKISSGLTHEDIEAIADAVYARIMVGMLPVDVRRINGAPVIGDGSEASPWRGEGVSP